MHPLDLFDRFRRVGFSRSSPLQRIWDRSPQQVAPDPAHDWLLEPVNAEEACSLFPHLGRERAVLRYQRLRLQMRQNDSRGF